jgi:Peptide methionine sulfoxide reductase
MFLGSGKKILVSAWCGYDIGWLLLVATITNQAMNWFCAGITGHAEVVKVDYHPPIISLMDF